MGSGSSTGRVPPEGDFPADAGHVAISPPTLLTHKAGDKQITEKPEESDAVAPQMPRGHGQAIIVENRRRRLSFAPACKPTDGAGLSNCERDSQVEASPGQTKRASATRRRLSVISTVSSCEDDGQVGASPVQTKHAPATRRLSVVSTFSSCEDNGQVGSLPVETKRGSATRRRLSVSSTFGSCADSGQIGLSPGQTKRGSATRRRLSLSGAGIVNMQEQDSQERPTVTSVTPQSSNGIDSVVDDRKTMGRRPRRQVLRESNLAEINSESDSFSDFGAGIVNMQEQDSQERPTVTSVTPQSSNGIDSVVDDRKTMGRRPRRQVLSESDLAEINSESDSFSDFGAESDGLLEFGHDSTDGDDELRALKCRYSRRRHSGVDVEGLKQYHQSPLLIHYAVPIKTFMQLSRLKSFEELQEEGLLVELTTGMPITFVALPWSCKSLPDPSGKQLQMLQDALSNLYGGNATIAGGLRRPDSIYSMEELANMAESYVWIGHCCLPNQAQDALECDDAAALQSSHGAFSALVDVVDRSEYFLALAESIVEDKEASLDFRESGWFRLAFVGRALRLGDTRVLLVEGAHNLRTICSQDHLWTPTAHGTFGRKSDLVAASTVLEELIERKQEAYLAAGRVEDYRLWRAMQNLLLKGTGAEGDDESSDESSDDSGEEEDLDKSSQAAKIASRRSSLPQVPSKSVQARAWDFLRIFGLVSAQQPDALNCTALHYAAICGSPKILKSLVSIGSGIEVRAEGYAEGADCTGHWPELKGMTPLHFAALLGQNPSNIDCLIKLGAQIDARDARQRTPLMLCCYADNLEVARRLIDLQAEVSLTDEVGCTALHQAAAYGRSQLCELLLSKGAPVTKSLLGTSPLFELALFSPTPGLVDTLVRAGCRVDEVSEISIERTAVKKWLEVKPMTSHRMFDCLLGAHPAMTTLMAASMAGNGKIVQALVEAGALG
eukprot:TRINITY_DN598_c0_g1_i1.p1 TRINITY_DN598_c0_g1~~TRINITY_DN598_c0_g1_i1.p1  ORF type:complete len:966 (-),score=195.91 TRINITY_DN598_c0_g1_i1:71-2926(-)